MTFSISEEAAEFINKKLVERSTPLALLRVGVSGSGCNGYAYRLEWYDDAPREKDTVFELNGAKVVIDPKSLLFLNDAILTMTKSLLRRGLAITNPNETGKCGCGDSISF